MSQDETHDGDPVTDLLVPATPAHGPTVTATDVAAALDGAAAGWVAGRRWFGSKSRAIADLTVLDVALDTDGDGQPGLAIVRLEYADGGEDRYLLPVLVTPTPTGVEHTIAAITGDRAVAIVDGPEEARFRGWLLQALADGRTIGAERGAFRFEPTAMLGDYLAAARSGSSRLIRSEQSNSSVIYGDAIIGKLFRRIQPGINPDLEIGRFLTEQTGFRAAPAMVGGISYLTDDGETSMGVLQIFMPNTGDAWTATLDELAALIETATADHVAELAPDCLDPAPAATLGRRTAEMHVALASSDSDPAFVPEPVTPDDIAAWERGTIESIEWNRAMLDNALPRLSPLQQQAVVAVDLSPHRLADRLGGYRALEGTVRIRVHGDYHLGQILRDMGGQPIILDFEGEPSRSIEERREKTAAMKDVAGMLRSLRYARAAALKAYTGAIDPVVIDHWLSQWEQASRTAFIDAYRAAVAGSARPLVPTDGSAFHAALAAWELDKALYELAYEANNRPTWLDVPLMTLAS